MENRLSKYYEIADALIKRLSRLVYGDVCIVCENNPAALDPGHYIGRGAKSVRWDIYNVFPQCRRCNSIHVYDEKPMTEKVLIILGIERHDELVVKSKTLFHPSVTAMQEIITDLREAIKDIEKVKKLVGLGIDIKQHISRA